MNDSHPTPASYPPNSYGAPSPYGVAGGPGATDYGSAGYDAAGYPPGCYGQTPHGVPGFPPGYNPWPGAYAGLRYASVWRRIGAYWIDGVIVLIVNLVAQTIFNAVSGDALKSNDPGQALTALLAFVVLVFVLDALYVVTQEAASGQTLGKRALGIRVVKTDGGPIDVDAALIRYVFLFFAFLGLGGLVTLLMVALSDTKQRLGDRVAGTVVIRSR